MTAPITSQKPLYVLVIEDNANAAKAMTLVLERDGRIKTTTARTMTGALLALQQSPLDAIVTDLRLPDCAETETVALLRRATNAPILAVTGLGGDMEAKVFLDGGDEFLEKCGLDPDRMTQIVHNAHARREATLKAAEIWRSLDSTQRAISVARELENRIKAAERRIEAKL